MCNSICQYVMTNLITKKKIKSQFFTNSSDKTMQWSNIEVLLKYVVNKSYVSYS